MSDQVVNWTVDILVNGLKNFAKEDKALIVRPSEVKIIIGISDINVTEISREHPVKRVIGEPFYRILKKDQPYMRERKLPGGDKVMTDQVSFLKILGGLLDMFQIEEQTKPVLIAAFDRFAEEENEALLNNEDFKAYIKGEQEMIAKPSTENGITQEHYEKACKEMEDGIIAENKIEPKDLEIMITTLKRPDVAGLAPNKQDEPIQPVLFLLIGDKKRKITIAEDLFQQVE
jgi:hypothetical protein